MHVEAERADVRLLHGDAAVWGEADERGIGAVISIFLKNITTPKVSEARMRKSPYYDF